MKKLILTLAIVLWAGVSFADISSNLVGEKT